MRAAAILALIGLLVGGAVMPVAAMETGHAFLWTGVHWQQVSEAGKAGYVFGIGNLADFEVAASRSAQPPCISRAFVDELKSKTVLQIVQAVDQFYKQNPDKLNTPVIEVVLRRCTQVCPAPPPAARKKK
ncbi:MAG: hypothetical protein P8168_03970 [Deltaproteobacteria bacterium]|jgi:hypothetical protein